MTRISLFVVLAATQLHGSPPVIDGVLEDAFWQEAPAEHFNPQGGGDLRVVVAGRYLYVAARLEEPTGRITARSVGHNPAWEEEDLLRITAGASIGYTDRILQVNPLGAYSSRRRFPARDG